MQHGPFQRWDSAGSLQEEGNYLDGQIEGILTTHYEDGKKSVAEFKAGLLNGTRRTFSSDGQLITTERFRAGQLVDDPAP
jgi:antitoxin component YwqK of YwqJK toxin-antitoxin module